MQLSALQGCRLQRNQPTNALAVHPKIHPLHCAALTGRSDQHESKKRLDDESWRCAHKARSKIDREHERSGSKSLGMRREELGFWRALRPQEDSLPFETRVINRSLNQRNSTTTPKIRRMNASCLSSKKASIAKRAFELATFIIRLRNTEGQLALHDSVSYGFKDFLLTVGGGRPSAYPAEYHAPPGRNMYCRTTPEAL